MLDIAIDARLQVIAGCALLETSELVTWEHDSEKLKPVSQPDFERALKRFHPVFGRLICWIIFSAGAELLAKGVCLHRGVELRTQDCVPAYPPADVPTWLETFKPNSPATVPTTNFGEIGKLYNGHLQSLFKKVAAPPHEKKRLLAAYEILGKTIRNRDAHAYVPRTRDAHFFLVSELFIPAMNDLLSWTQLPAGELNKWRNEAQQFIDDLDLTSEQHLATSICDEVATRKKKLTPFPA